MLRCGTALRGLSVLRLTARSGALEYAGRCDGGIRLPESRFASPRQYGCADRVCAHLAGFGGKRPCKESAPAPPLEPAQKPEEPLCLAAGDVLDVHCFNDTSLSRERCIRTDGAIGLPLIGDLLLAGLTIEEAEQRVREAYGRVFRNPQVSVTLRSSVRRSCTVIGAVALPGRYPCMEQMTLTMALECAGGTPRADTKSRGDHS